MIENVNEAEFESWYRAGAYILLCWRNELRDFLNERFRLFGRRSFPPITVEYHSQKLIMFLDGAPENSREFLLEGAGFSSIEFVRAIKSFGNCREVTLLIPESEALRISIRVPVVRSSLMKSALGYELDRLSPVPSESLYFDFIRGEIDPISGTADYMARAVRRTAVDQTIRLCKNAGLEVSEIRFGGDPAAVNGRLFAIESSVLLRSLWRRHSLLLLVALLLFVGSLSLIAGYARQSDVLSALDAQMITASQNAARVDRVEHQIAATNSEIASIAHAKSKPPFLSVLAKITRVLPDGSWVTRFEGDGRKIHLQGYSDNASKLVALLDRSGLFQNAQFDAAVIQDASVHADRFDLTADLVGAEQ